jgi:hypothetical protein
LPDWPCTGPRCVSCQNQSENCTRACVILILRNEWTPLLDWHNTYPRRVTCQNESEQCPGACVIPVQACRPGAEPCKEVLDCLKTGGLLRNGWTPLPDGPHTCPRQVMRQNESEHCTRACLIPIRALEPSTKPCKEGVDCFEMDGVRCQIGQTLAQDKLHIKMSQSSVVEHFLLPIQDCGPSAEPFKEGVDCLKTGGLLRNGWTALPDQPGTCPRRVTCQIESEQCTRSQFKPSSPVLNIGKKEWTAGKLVDCFEV